MLISFCFSGCGAGRPVVLDALTEKLLVGGLITMADFGWGYDIHEIRYILKHFMDENKIQDSPFKNNLPSRDWVAQFVKRNKLLSRRVAQKLPVDHAIGLTNNSIKRWFEKLAEAETQPGEWNLPTN